MAQTDKNGRVILLGDPGYNPVSHDKPAPGGQTDHTSPGIGQSIRNALMSATGMDKVNKALGGK